jgi:hypothetical protein
MYQSSEYTGYHGIRNTKDPMKFIFQNHHPIYENTEKKSNATQHLTNPNRIKQIMYRFFYLFCLLDQEEA